ncbi:MAG: cytochrome P450, partial [bacterium]
LYDSANRDERAFEQPMDFDITRHPNEHIAFGWGPHFCLGASLARLELRVMFEEVARAMPGLQLVDGGSPPRRPSNFISGITHLPVSLAA